MTATIKKRIEKAEATLLAPPPTFIRTVLIGQPPENSGAQAWVEYERAIAEAGQAGAMAILLVPLSPSHRSPSLDF